MSTLGAILLCVGILSICITDYILTDRKINKKAKLAQTMRELALAKREIETESSNHNDPEMEKKDENVNYSELSTEEITKRSMDAMFDILRSLGCQPKLYCENAIEVMFQGENFLMEIKSIWVRIWDTGWFHIPTDHPDVTLIKESVNITNITFGPTILLKQSDDEDDIILHSRMDIMVYPSCPINKDYIRAILDSFFGIKEVLRVNIHKSRMSNEKEKKQKPVGFDLSDIQQN